MITRILAITLAALASIAIVACPSFEEAPHPVGLPDTLFLSGAPGSTPSSSFLVYVSNSTQPLSILTISATMLQDKAGHQIPTSSINLTPAPLTVNANRVLTLTITVFVAAGTTPGNYSGRLVLLAENGSTTALGLNLTVSAPYWAYVVVIILIVGGVTLSFLYSPLGDQKPENPEKKHTEELKKMSVQNLSVQDLALRAQVEREFVREMAHYIWTGTAEDKNRNHLALYGTAATLALVGFAYFFASATDFWALPLRDGATAFLQGFLVHRGLDGLAPKIFK